MLLLAPWWQAPGAVLDSCRGRHHDAEVWLVLGAHAASQYEFTSISCGADYTLAIKTAVSSGEAHVCLAIY